MTPKPFAASVKVIDYTIPWSSLYQFKAQFCKEQIKMCELYVKMGSDEFKKIEVYTTNYGASINNEGVKVYGLSDSSDERKVYKTKCNGTYSPEIDITFKQ